MGTLTITTAEIKRLCAIPTADTDQDADIAALITAEQPALEYGLDPAVLTASALDAGLLAVLTLGVSERLAGSYLEQLARSPGWTDDFQIGGLHVSASRTDNLAQLGARLAGQGVKRLDAFVRAGRRVALDAVADLPDSSTKAVALVAGPVIKSSIASVFDEISDGLDNGEGVDGC